MFIFLLLLLYLFRTLTFCISSLSLVPISFFLFVSLNIFSFLLVISPKPSSFVRSYFLLIFISCLFSSIPSSSLSSPSYFDLLLVSLISFPLLFIPPLNIFCLFSYLSKHFPSTIPLPYSRFWDFDANVLILSIFLLLLVYLLIYFLLIYVFCYLSKHYSTNHFWYQTLPLSGFLLILSFLSFLLINSLMFIFLLSFLSFCSSLLVSYLYPPSIPSILSSRSISSLNIFLSFCYLLPPPYPLFYFLLILDFSSSCPLVYFLLLLVSLNIFCLFLPPPYPLVSIFLLTFLSLVSFSPLLYSFSSFSFSFLFPSCLLVISPYLRSISFFFVISSLSFLPPPRPSYFLLTFGISYFFSLFLPPPYPLVPIFSYFWYLSLSPSILPPPFPLVPISFLLLVSLVVSPSIPSSSLSSFLFPSYFWYLLLVLSIPSSSLSSRSYFLLTFLSFTCTPNYSFLLLILSFLFPSYFWYLLLYPPPSIYSSSLSSSFLFPSYFWYLLLYPTLFSSSFVLSFLFLLFFGLSYYSPSIYSFFSSLFGISRYDFPSYFSF
ncbi:unnamed protein product [Acanthosepion pharaonis]|uniref:Uncharacterized protein n=1 Tax=Acanthosepion pharaonis TaxID=158019 RepID=A0A812DLI9_ACAPH|nr:unnamed protein product [Sepia pharaonis]